MALERGACWHGIKLDKAVVELSESFLDVLSVGLSVNSMLDIDAVGRLAEGMSRNSLLLKRLLNIRLANIEL